MTGREEGRRRWEPSWCRDSSSPSPAGGAAGRSAGRAVPGAPLARPRAGKGGGCPPRAASAPSRRAAPLALPAAAWGPAPWSPQAACFPPWWSWATSPPWSPCGSGAGGAGGRRRRKVSRRRLCPGLSPATAAAPARGSWSRGGAGARAASSHPCISSSPPLPVPSGAAARGRRTAVLPLPPTRHRRPCGSPGWTGAEPGAGVGGPCRGAPRPLAERPPVRGARRARAAVNTAAGRSRPLGG